MDQSLLRHHIVVFEKIKHSAPYAGKPLHESRSGSNHPRIVSEGAPDAVGTMGGAGERR
ncbi:MAG TPA: hypothetical protein VN950_22145 [Terriglobales bacterium]|nr:hypothetical protein [Terriglobales bacterium]